MIWSYCKHMSKYENWGDPDGMCSLTVFSLDFIRDYTKLPLVLHCGKESSGHSDHSFHPLGLAGDFNLIGCDLLCAANKILEAIKLMGLKNYGLGVYPWWKNPGFHFDNGFPGYGNRKTAILYWVSNEQGKYDYYYDAGSWIKAISL